VLIVFDLDGTLVDSLRDLADASNELLASYGAAPLDEAAIGSMVGEGAATLVKRVLAARGLPVAPDEALMKFLALYDGRLLTHTRPYDGIIEALSALRTHAALAVLTNKPAQPTHRILDALALSRFFGWITGGDGPDGRKPRPEGLQALMASAGSNPRDTVLVGDSGVDVLTARYAGIRVCLARYGFGYRSLPGGILDGSEMAVDHPRELPSVLVGG
jgi:phosphoglycolate phosphatase